MTGRKAKAKRRVFTMKEKVTLIEESMQPGYSQVRAAMTHGMKQSTLACILRDKQKILAVAQSCQKSKHFSKGKEHQLEEDLYAWFLKVRGKGALINDPTVRRQAEVMAKKINLNTTLAFSHGWLMRWRRRFGVEFKETHGEKLDADTVAADKWVKEVLPTILARYKPWQIYNCDETGFFYRGTARKGFVVAGEKPADSEQAKEHLTALVTYNMDGSVKPNLLIIGKSVQPRGFPRNHSLLPMDYESSRKAWMDSKIWEKFLMKWDRELCNKKQPILLLADNAPAPPPCQGLDQHRALLPAQEHDQPGAASGCRDHQELERYTPKIVKLLS